MSSGAMACPGSCATALRGESASAAASAGGCRGRSARDCGLLAGTYRQQLLNEGRAREAVLTREQLFQADRLYVANAVQGLRPARLLEPDQGRGNSG